MPAELGQSDLTVSGGREDCSYVGNKVSQVAP